MLTFKLPFRVTGPVVTAAALTAKVALPLTVTAPVERAERDPMAKEPVTPGAPLIVKVFAPIVTAPMDAPDAGTWIAELAVTATLLPLKSWTAVATGEFVPLTAKTLRMPVLFVRPNVIVVIVLAASAADRVISAW